VQDAAAATDVLVVQPANNNGADVDGGGVMQQSDVVQPDAHDDEGSMFEEEPALRRSQDRVMHNILRVQVTRHV
jgi:hypothetical protein